MKLKLLCLGTLMCPTIALAGTNTGCSGDQWSSHLSSDNNSPQKMQWVYHTNKLWSIGFSGYETKACGLEISARNNSDTEVFMENGTCTYHFQANKAQLTVKSAARANCRCQGIYNLKKSCSKEDN